MDLGKKILALRKKENLSQEQLAEKMSVTRQTISKWELNETTPDIKQAKELSKIFNISLDELTCNEINSVVVKKISNTEKLAGIVLKGIKILVIIFLIILVIDITSLILFQSVKVSEQYTKMEMKCSKDNETYIITTDTKNEFFCDKCSEKMREELKKEIDSNLEITVKNIENYFESNNGICE